MTPSKVAHLVEIKARHQRVARSQSRCVVSVNKILNMLPSPLVCRTASFLATGDFKF